MCVFQHSGHASEKTLLMVGGDEEETAEVDDLHVDENPKALMPQRRGCSNSNQRINQLCILSNAVRYVWDVPEDVVCKTL